MTPEKALFWKMAAQSNLDLANKYMMEAERMRAALQECAAPWASEPGTVMSAAQELSAEFQRRLNLAAHALSPQQGEAGAK